MKRRALITGITGQDGSYLSELLLSKDYEVHGIVRRTSSTNRERIQHVLDKVHLHEGDMLDQASLRSIVNATKPHEVYNLAAQSHVHTSFSQPEFTAEVTGLGALRLLEALRSLKETDVPVYQASSSEMFGDVTQNVQDEQTPLRARSPYGAAKIFAHQICKVYREAYGMPISCGILMNHESPRRGMEFVTRKIAWHAVQHALGKLNTPLRLGNLDAVRDWGYAGDYVEAMWLMLQQPKPDDFVIATGETHSVREFVEKTYAILGIALDWAPVGMHSSGQPLESAYVVSCPSSLSSVFGLRVTAQEPIVVVDPEMFRPADVYTLKGNCSKARAHLRWQPKTTFESLVEMMTKAEFDAAHVSAQIARYFKRC